MFLNNQDPKKIEYYQKMLKAAGSLSNLFSESLEPYLGYRLVENLFCKSFDAENLSRSDTSIDASKDNIGIGLKTFTYKNGKGYEKVAEFNRDLASFKGLGTEDMVFRVSELRNERINFCKRTYKLNHLLYHCVTRTSGKIIIYETSMPLININNITNISVQNNSVRFKDGDHNYSFSIAKSTLLKQFLAENPFMDFPVKIIRDPFEMLEKLLQDSIKEQIFAPVVREPHIFLPMFSNKNNSEKFVPERSGLNQWNAAGRTRNISEVYIPIPALIRREYPSFFPNREVKFKLHLPNKEIINAKVCQDNDKALMSDPNAKLGEWLLREVLKLKDGELLTYEKLEELGVDSVAIYKIDEGNYKIDFAKIGSYDNFVQGADDQNLEEE